MLSALPPIGAVLAILMPGGREQAKG